MDYSAVLSAFCDGCSWLSLSLEKALFLSLKGRFFSPVLYQLSYLSGSFYDSENPRL